MEVDDGQRVDVKTRAPAQVLNSLWETVELRIPAHTRIGPANHHTKYFDLVVDPRSPKRELLEEEISGTNHACSLCHESRSSKCPGHRIGMRIPFYIIQPEFAKIFAKFINSLCINAQIESENCIHFYGCGMPRSSTCVRSTLSKRLATTNSKCKSCEAERNGPYTQCKFTAGSKETIREVPNGSLFYICGKNVARVSLNALLEFLSLPHIHDNIQRAHELYGTNFDLRSMVTDILYVTPFQLRPTLDGRQHYETLMYQKIFSTCREFGLCDDVELAASSSRAGVLYSLIAQLMASHAKTPETETQFQRLKGKHGLIRQFVAGAHSWNEGRGVVIPSLANFGEFVISRYYQSLLVMETVTQYNMGRLNLLADERMLVWIKRYGAINETRFRFGQALSIGDVVYRNIVTGDVGIANRQPTLHRLALAGHHLKFTNAPVVALNKSETTPLNADFDGDEMTVHVALTPEARIELQSHAHVVNCVHESGGPAMSIVFHELAIMMILSIKSIEKIPNAAKYLAAFTSSKDLERRIESYPWRRQYAKRHIFVSAETSARAVLIKHFDDWSVLATRLKTLILASRTSTDSSKNIVETTRNMVRTLQLSELHATVSKEVTYPLGADNVLIETYGDAISLLFPEGFTYRAKGAEIVRGVYVSGEFKSSNIGLAAGSIVHMIYPSKRAALFINDVQRICEVYMNSHGTTFDVRDMVYSDEYYNEIARMVSSTREELEKALQRRAAAISSMERDQIEKKITLLTTASTGHIMKTIEQSTKKLSTLIKDLNDRGIVGQERYNALQALRDDRIKNVFEIMYTSGCRGSTRTAVQMSMMLGSQYVGGVRADPSKMPWIDNPHAFPGSDGRRKQTPLSNGIVESSLIMGLTPSQYILHSDPVRFQIIRGKLDVGATGYISKQMSTVLSFNTTKDDMKVIYGTCVVAHAMGGWITPTSLLLGKYKGHGAASMVDMGTLVEETAYLFDKARR